MNEDHFSFSPVEIKFERVKFKGNSEWSIENAFIASFMQNESGVWGESGPSFKYIFQLKRRPTYYITVIIIPTFLITVVGIVGIFSPGTDHEPGDVVNLGLGALLAFMILLGIISEKLPKSEEIPLLGYHILAILIVFVFIILLEVSSLYYFQRRSNSGKRPPLWMSKIGKFQFPFFEKKEEDKEADPYLNMDSDTGVASTETESVKSGSLPSRSESFSKDRTLLRRIISKDKKSFKWLQTIREWENREVEEQRKLIEKAKITKEWDKIETRLDFIWIFIFEVLNLINFLSLFYFANVAVPNKNWDDLL